VNFVDVIFFQAEIAPEKLALVAHGSVIPYGRFARGILSAQQRLTAIGLKEGQTVGLHIAHPIDHLVIACALYRMKVASASITNVVDLYLEHVPFDAVLADIVLPTVSTKQPQAKMVLVDPSWFQDKIEFSVKERTTSRRDPAPGWVSRITCFRDGTTLTPVVKTTSASLEAQLLSYCISAPPRWDRMITVAGLHADTGFIQALSALWLGRSVCLADLPTARGLISIYKHDYLVMTADDVESFVRAQETQFVALPGLRAACIEGRGWTASTINRALATISLNLLLRYSHPDIGIIAYGDAARIKQVGGAVGFVAPWIEAQVVDAVRTPLAAEKEGELRVRLRDGGLSVAASAPRDKTDGWIYPQQRARLTGANLLVVTGPAVPV
jgi:hypothetical protein